MIEKKEFTAMYRPFFQLHPFKKRDWPDGLGDVHYQAFCRDSPALLKDALGMLIEKLDHFPTPKDIRTQITALSTSKSETGGARTNESSDNEMLATRYLEYKHGVEYDGVKVKCPENLPSWIKQETDRVDELLGSQYPLKSKLGSVGFAIIQREKRA